MNVQFLTGIVHSLILTTKSTLLYKFVHILQAFIIPQKYIKCGFISEFFQAEQ